MTLLAFSRAGPFLTREQTTRSKPILSNARGAERVKYIKVFLSLTALAVAVVFVLSTTDFEALKSAARNLSAPVILGASLAMMAGYLIASARIQALAFKSGHTLDFRQAVAAISAGQIAANLFFQVVGQVIARGLLFSRAGIPLATTVVITGYERVFAFVVSVLMAVCGALYLFGVISVDAQAGGFDFLKLFVGGTLALVIGAWLGWGELARMQMPKFNRRLVHHLLLVFLLSSAIQLSTMAAYVLVAHALAPQIPIFHIAAAASVVMLAASLPISLAGWGIREVSAVFALGAVGLSPGESLISAMAIGILSLLVAAVLTGLSHRAWRARGSVVDTVKPAGRDFGSMLANWLPIAAATAVCFQIYVPSGSGRINLNFADPIAILGGALFAIWHVRDRAWPTWRAPYVNGFLIIFSIDTLIALTNGYFRMGWTLWAFTNKGLGWLVLVAYFFVGAMIASLPPRKGIDILLGTFVGSLTSIAALDLFLLALRSTGVPVPEHLLPFRLSGFAQNPNAFGFQLLLAIAATVVLDLGRLTRACIVGTLFAAIWLSGSRAAFGSALVMAAMAPLAFWGVSRKALARGFFVAACSAAVTVILLFLLKDSAKQGVLFSILHNQDGERFESIRGGLALFFSSPIFGEGLGAFVHDHAAKTGTFLPIHSTPVWLLAEYGIVGFLIVYGAVFYLWRQAVYQTWPSEQINKFVFLLLTAFVTMSVAHEMLYQRALWLLLGAALATHGSLRVTARPD